MDMSRGNGQAVAGRERWGAEQAYADQRVERGSGWDASDGSRAGAHSDRTESWVGGSIAVGSGNGRRSAGW